MLPKTILEIWSGSVARHFNIELNKNALHLLDGFVEELLSTNKATNLNAIVNFGEIIDKLILNSIFPCLFVSSGSPTLEFQAQYINYFYFSLLVFALVF